MIKRFRVHITHAGETAFLREARFIAESSGYPSRAKDWLSGLHDRAETLELYPHRCGLAEEQAYRDIDIRKLNHHNHLILFVVDDPGQIVYVIGCRHGASRPRPGDLPTDPRET